MKGQRGLKELVLDYLSRHNTMTLATANNNAPWAASLFYASQGFTLYFISSPDVCLHCQNIAANPRVAVTIYEDYSLDSINDWRKVKGIQMEGTAEMLTTEEDVRQAVEAYTKKYHFVAVYLKSVVSFPKVVSLLETIVRKLKITPNFTASSDNKFYRITATRVWFVDNETSFEKRQEVPL